MSAELNREYHKLRRNLLKQRRYYINKGIDIPQNIIPSIPKKITEASVRKLQSIIINPEQRKRTKEYNKLLQQYEQKLTVASRLYSDKQHKGKDYGEIPEQLGNIKIVSPRKASKKNIEELKHEIKKTNIYVKRETANFNKRHNVPKPPKKEKPVKKPTKEPTPIDPYSDDFWEDWEEGPPRDWTEYDEEIAKNLPKEEDILADNLEETLIDFGLYDTVEKELLNWEPLEWWTPAFARKKEIDKDTALGIFLGAVDRDGKKTVAKRINEYGPEIIELVMSICFDSDKQDMIRFKTNLFSHIVNDRSISFEENMRYTEASDNYGFYN